MTQQQTAQDDPEQYHLSEIGSPSNYHAITPVGAVISFPEAKRTQYPDGLLKVVDWTQDGEYGKQLFVLADAETEQYETTLAGPAPTAPPSANDPTVLLHRYEDPNQ